MVVFYFVASISKAQDPQFSQYYAAPIFLNPALTGIHQVGSAGINYRSQWPNIQATFETTSFYLDYNFEDYGSSVGLMINRDREGIANLQSTSVQLIYAYQADLNYKWAFRPALQVGYGARNIDFSKLTFGDQFDNRGLVRPISAEQLNINVARYLDFSIGGIVYNKQVWLGYAMHHINEPNQSLIGEEALLRRKYSLHAGYKFSLSRINPFWESDSGKERSFTPTFNYKEQFNFRQLDAGFYFTLEPVLFGLWYRGIPVSAFKNTRNNEALVVMFGLNMGQTMLGYSFDYTLSDLGIATGGAHEISLTYLFSLAPPNKPAREVRQLKCPVPFVF